MTDFDFDIKQKKSIANSARHRVCGSKSRRCSLPSDNLTPAQIRKRNGEVVTVNLKQPMHWVQFKSLPEDLQVDYVTGLREEYKATPASLARMFGVAHITVSRYFDQHGIHRDHESDHSRLRMSDDDKRRWNAFLHPETETPAPEPPVELETALDTESKALEAPEAVETEAVEQRAYAEMEITFDDVNSWEQLYALLKAFPGPHASSTVRVKVS